MDTHQYQCENGKQTNKQNYLEAGQREPAPVYRVKRDDLPNDPRMGIKVVKAIKARFGSGVR